MFSKTNLDDAVSPVIGVILMVAVTVILSAVIGSLVFDIGSNTQANPQAGVSLSTDGGEVTATLVSMQNADGIYLKTEEGYHLNNTFSQLSEPENYTLSGVGDSATGIHNGNEVVVIAELNGEQTVLQTYEP